MKNCAAMKKIENIYYYDALCLELLEDKLPNQRINQIGLAIAKKKCRVFMACAYFRTSASSKKITKKGDEC